MTIKTRLKIIIKNLNKGLLIYQMIIDNGNNNDDYSNENSNMK